LDGRFVFAKRPRGEPLGNRVNLGKAQALGAAAVAVEARRFAENVAPVIREVRASGARSLRGIAAALNARGVRTARGGRWAVRRAEPCR
jgi:hypothetical protein